MLEQKAVAVELYIEEVKHILCFKDIVGQWSLLLLVAVELQFLLLSLNILYKGKGYTKFLAETIEVLAVVGQVDVHLLLAVQIA